MSQTDHLSPSGGAPGLEATGSARITNSAGLHARPCHALVSAALEFESRLTVRHGDRSVNGKSILELMTLGATNGTLLEIHAEGEDAQALVSRIVDLIQSGFGEGD